MTFHLPSLTRVPVDAARHTAFRPQMQDRLRQHHVTAGQIQRRLLAMQSESDSQVKFSALMVRHLERFGDDPAKFFAAASLVYAPSTVVRYAQTTRKIMPQHAESMKNVINYARKMMGTPKYAPKQAARFDLERFARFVRNTKSAEMRDTMIILFATASRAGDLMHFLPTPYDQHNPPAWRIQMVVVQTDEDNFHSHKSDRKGTRNVSKWIPQHPLIKMHATWPPWRQVYDHMKRIDCSGHSMRGTAVNLLEEEGFTKEQIRCLTAHTPTSGNQALAVEHYSCHTPHEPDAVMSLQLSGILLSKLTLAMSQTPCLLRSMTAMNQ